jgi:hypothetical protein
VAVYVVGRAGVGWLRSDSFTALDIVAPVASAIPFVVVAALWLARAREGERSGFVEALWLTAVLFLVVNAVANLVQVVLWKATGRLPALAFEDGVVRFGGVWDDPNSSAAYAAAMGLALVAAPIRTSVAARVALGWCVLFNLVVAWSYAAVVLVVFALACFYLMERWRLVLAAGVLASAVLVGLLTLPPDTAETPAGGLGRVAEAKQASTEQRTRLETYLETPSGPGEWLVGKDQPGVVESAFGNWLTATGLVGLVLAAAWLFLTLRVIWRSPQRRWATALIVGVLASSVFIPHIVVFPVGAFFVFAIGLMASFYEREPSRAIQPAGP